MAGPGFDDGRNEATQMGQPHIFCVNGSPVFLDLLRALFQEESYNVTTTNYVPENWGMIEGLQPSLIVVDLVVGQRAGWELLRRLHAEASTRQIPTIVTSTDPRLLDEVQSDLETWGGNVFLVKPLDVNLLLATARRLIAEQAPYTRDTVGAC